ncbi:MAG: HNH endonuclease [Acidobacteriota bacterium]|nr:HNH endonuclease [Acidobacteriota bacterium]
MSEISNETRRKVREAAGNNCGYCLSRQRYTMSVLEIEHIIPKSNGGANAEENLWLSCGLCNRYKGTQTDGFDEETQNIVALFNPRRQIWTEHFAWSADGTRITGITPTGRVTVNALKLNNDIAVEVRRNWILAGWHPPKF